MPIKQISILGGSKVGKTNFALQLIHGNVPAQQKYKPTVEDFYRKTVNWKGEIFQLNIIDTAGTYTFPAMRKLHIETSDGFFIVYTDESMDSVKEIQRIYEQITAAGKEKTACVIIRNRALFRTELSEQVTYSRKLCAEVISLYLKTMQCRHVEISEDIPHSVQRAFNEMLLLLNPYEGTSDDVIPFVASYNIRRNKHLGHFRNLSLPSVFKKSSENTEEK